MNATVVCYSLQGSTKRAAEQVAHELGARLVELSCVKPYPTSGPLRLALGAKDALAGATPELLPYEFDARGCDLLVVAGPIWAGKMAAPLNTFVRDQADVLSGLRVAGLVTSGAPKPGYANAPRVLLGRDTSMPVLHLTTKQVADNAELSRVTAEFCKGLLASA